MPLVRLSVCRSCVHFRAECSRTLSTPRIRAEPRSQSLTPGQFAHLDLHKERNLSQRLALGLATGFAALQLAVAPAGAVLTLDDAAKRYSLIQHDSVVLEQRLEALEELLEDAEKRVEACEQKQTCYKNVQTSGKGDKEKCNKMKCDILGEEVDAYLFELMDTENLMQQLALMEVDLLQSMKEAGLEVPKETPQLVQDFKDLAEMLGNELEEYNLEEGQEIIAALKVVKDHWEKKLQETVDEQEQNDIRNELLLVDQQLEEVQSRYQSLLREAGSSS